MGFMPTAWSTDGEWQIMNFYKPKATQTHQFLDHMFNGRVCYALAPNGVQVAVNLIFQDTLLMETGEFKKMKALCEHIALASDQFTYKTIPLTIISGLMMSYISIGIVLYCGIHQASEYPIFVPILAAMQSATGLFTALTDRARIQGAKLAVMGIGISVILCAGGLIAYLR